MTPYRQIKERRKEREAVYSKIVRSTEDLLFQVLVDWGIHLALPIATEIIAGKQVFFVDTNALAACFDAGLVQVHCG